MILTIVFAALTVLVTAAAVALLLFQRRRYSLELRENELKLRRLEGAASREATERLRFMAQRTGALYLDGLVFARDRELARLFGSGLAFGFKQQWGRALADWSAARKRAKGTELAALTFLCGACHFMVGQMPAAQKELEQALELASEAKDRVGQAACQRLLAEISVQRDPARTAELLDQSARLWHELGEVGLEARTTACQARLEQGERALELHRKALRLAEEADDRRTAAVEYGEVGNLLLAEGRLEQARAALEDGLHLAREIGDRQLEVERLLSIGEIHSKQGAGRRAADVFERALRFFQDSGAKPRQAQLLYRLAVAHQQAGDFEVGQEYFEQALNLARETGDSALQAECLAGVASEMVERGAWQRSRDLLDAANEIDRQTGNQAALGRHLLLRAKVQVEQEQYGGAEEDLKLVEQVAAKDAGLATAARLLRARVSRKQGRTDEARELIERSRQAAAGNDEREAGLLSESGKLKLAAGDVAGARQDLGRAVEFDRKSGRVARLGLDLVALGRVLVRSGEVEAGVRSIEDGLKQLHQAGARTQEAQALAILARANEQQSKFAAAQDNLRRALELARDAGEERIEADFLRQAGQMFVRRGEVERGRGLLERARRGFARLGDEQRVAQVARELAELPRPESGVSFLDSGDHSD